MARYHINYKGEPGACHAQKQCPFGDMAKDHFDSPDQARHAYEDANQDYAVAKTVRKHQATSPLQKKENFDSLLTAINQTADQEEVSEVSMEDVRVYEGDELTFDGSDPDSYVIIEDPTPENIAQALAKFDTDPEVGQE
jgi:hypothetical protein